MGNTLDLMKIILIIMAFWSFGITTLTYALPTDTLEYISVFEGSTDFDIEEIGADIEASMTQQTNIPVVELGALVFYSGNILLDLLLNFAFAIPEMIGMFISGLCLLFNLDAYLVLVVQTLFSALISALYLIGLIQLITSIRSGQSII